MSSPMVLRPYKEDTWEYHRDVLVHYGVVFPRVDTRIQCTLGGVNPVSPTGVPRLVPQVGRYHLLDIPLSPPPSLLYAIYMLYATGDVCSTVSPAAAMLYTV